MNEREAWDAYVESVIDNPVGPTAKDIWQAACAWQREQDAKIGANLDADFADEFALAIREGK